MSKLSAIMPVYNTSAFLRRSIESVLKQTFIDLELILVNDGSTDNSLDICKEFARIDSRVIVIDQENKGAGAARNAGLKIAKGKYVAFPDSDDWIEPDAYGACIKEMENNSLDLLVFGSINTVYNEKQEVSEEEHGAVRDFFFKTQDECRKNWSHCISELPMGGPSNKIYRKSIIDDHNISFPNIRRMQDGVFNILYYNYVERFMFVNKYYYHFTAHPAAYQRRKIPKDYMECAILYHKTALETLDSWEMSIKEHVDVFDNWFSETVVDALHYYSPSGDNSFISTYRYVKSIVTDSYIRAFFKKYLKAKKHSSKTEKAIRYKQILLLTIDVIRK